MTTQKIIAKCFGCGKSYEVDYGKIEGSSTQVECSHCQTVNTVCNFKISPNPLPPVQFKIQGLSLRFKVTLVIVLLVIGSLSVVGTFASLKSRQALLNQAKQHLSLLTTQKATQYGLIFKRLAEEVEAVSDFSKAIYSQKTISDDLGMDDYLLMPWTGYGYGNLRLNEKLKDEKRGLHHVVRMLKSLVTRNPYVTLGYLGTATNIMAINDPAAVMSISKREAYVNSKRPWYTKAAQKGETIWTAPYVDANTQNLIVTCANPVSGDKDEYFGVVGFDVLLKTIQEDILSLDIGYNNSYAMLIDNAGNALVKPGMSKKDTRWDKTYDAENLLKTQNIEFNAIIERMVQGNLDIESYNSVEGRKLIAYTTLHYIDASLAIVVPENEVVQSATLIQRFIITVWAFVLVIAIFIGISIGNGITKPIEKLTSTADMISQGKLNLEELPVERKDEIGVLTRSFNRLITSLKIALTR